MTVVLNLSLVDDTLTQLMTLVYVQRLTVPNVVMLKIKNCSTVPYCF